MVLLRRDGMSLQAQTSLFQSLLEQPFCRPFKIHKGDTFLVQGECANQLFLVNKCDFSVSYLTPAGKRYIVNSQRGFTGVLGEMEVFRPEGRYVFSVTALSDANGYQISRAKLLEAVAQQPDMAINFLQLVTGRYEESIGHTLSNILYTLRFNIIRVMLNKSAEANDGWFEFKTDQHASELGATTRAFRRVVKDWWTKAWWTKSVAPTVLRNWMSLKTNWMPANRKRFLANVFVLMMIFSISHFFCSDLFAS